MANPKNGKAKRKYAAQAQQVKPVQATQPQSSTRRAHWVLGIVTLLLMVCGAVAATTYSKASNPEPKTWGFNSTGGPRDRVTYSDGDVDIVAAGLLHVGDVLTKEDGTSQTVEMIESEAPGGVKPIEKIEVGEMVKTSPDPMAVRTSEGEKSIDDEEVNAQTWRDLKLVMREADGGKTDIRLLRPTWWIEKNGIEVGKSFNLKIPEMEKEGPTTVLAVAPLPHGETYGKGTVTGTFKHEAANIVNLQLASLKQPLGVTTSHPFYSVTRKDWASVGSLRVGEEVKTDTGKTKVVSVEPRAKSEAVYNIEVHGDHTYFVGGKNGGAWVHNTCPPEFPKTAKDMDDFLGFPGERVPDGPTTPGRDKTVWRPSQDIKITLEQHPYHPNAPAWHRDPHYHVDTPGNPHQRFLPGDPIPGY